MYKHKRIREEKQKTKRRMFNWKYSENKWINSICVWFSLFMTSTLLFMTPIYLQYFVY